ncbi:hypothetical protein [Streptomyces flavofungini]|uniref:hypothetical protein n=1 Tax=Streptomyces flavofungini TaxID=68200 RepID=UPI0034DECCFD
MRFRSRVVRVVLAGTLLAGALAATTAAPATASSAGALSCSHSWSNKSAQESYVYGTGVNLRSGPHSGSDGCRIIGQLQDHELLYAHCWDTGTPVNGDRAWWHVRRAVNSQNGWVSNEYTWFTTNNGSHC